MLPRLLHPVTNPTGLAAAAGAIYAAAVMIYNAYEHHGVISAPVIIAALAAITALLTHQVVTPVADPVDGSGRKLVPAPEPARVPAFRDTGTVHLLPPALGSGDALSATGPLRPVPPEPGPGELA